MHSPTRICGNINKQVKLMNKKAIANETIVTIIIVFIVVFLVIAWMSGLVDQTWRWIDSLFTFT